jgi:hypothetical protein
MLGRGNLKSTWITLRRVVAIAELIGLPRASYEREIPAGTRAPTRKHGTPSDPEGLRLKAMVWEAICATDRNFSMMMNISAGTARYAFPLNKSLSGDGNTSAQAYNYQLSAICAAGFEIDESYVRGVSEAECYEAVLSADSRLRVLAGQAPRTWWQTNDTDPLAERLVKFWHYYITARVHLRPAMTNDDIGDQYTYSRTVCRDACQNAVRRFCRFRLSIPSGFFVCRMLDVQAFTAATFLLISSRSYGADPGSGSQSPRALIDPQRMDLVRELVECFKLVSDQAGSGFAREAVTALTSLESLIQGKCTGQSGPLRLQVPMLGTVCFGGPGNPTANQTSAADLEKAAGSQGTSENYPLGGPVSEAGHNVSTVTSPAMSTVTAPVPWTFEFDNAPFWAQSVLPVDNVNIIDYQGYVDPMNSWV